MTRRMADVEAQMLRHRCGLLVGAWLMLIREFADTDEKIVQSKLGHCTDERTLSAK